jgi:hypothetical protein
MSDAAEIEETDVRDELKDVLEGLVDNIGLLDVLDRLTDICYDKAERLSQQWANTSEVERWLHIARGLTEAGALCVSQTGAGDG